MATRMAGIQAKLELASDTPFPDKFADVYKIEGIEEIDAKMKGRSSIVGLWMFATDARESMIEVMRRSVFTCCVVFLVADVWFGVEDYTRSSRRTFLTLKSSDTDLLGHLHHTVYEQ